MFEGGYKIRNQAATHFVTCTVVDWVDVFTRQLYRDILLDSLRFSQANKGLLINSWCLMSNHLHMVASAKQHNFSDVLRDLKKFTSWQIIKTIAGNKSESRRDWMLRLFQDRARANSRNQHYQFWKHDNHPEELYSAAFTFQKINYIHQNPVAAGIVANPCEYIYSSARDYHEGRKCGLLNIVF